MANGFFTKSRSSENCTLQLNALIMYTTLNVPRGAGELSHPECKPFKKRCWFFSDLVYEKTLEALPPKPVFRIDNEIHHETFLMSNKTCEAQKSHLLDRQHLPEGKSTLI